MAPRRRSKSHKKQKKVGATPLQSKQNNSSGIGKDSSGGQHLFYFLAAVILLTAIFAMINCDLSAEDITWSWAPLDEQADFHELEVAEEMPQPQELQSYCDDNGDNCVEMYPWLTLSGRYEPDPSCVNKRPDECNRSRRKRCHLSPGWMTEFCPVTCRACSLRDPLKRCNMKSYPDRQLPAVSQPGDIAKRFDRLAERFPQYEPMLMTKGDPYLAIFKNFLSEKEADVLMRWLEKLNPTKSQTQSKEWNGGVRRKVDSQIRTSENSWCTRECWEDEDVRRVTSRVSRVLDVPIRNYESYQLVRYTQGQYYRTHSDCNINGSLITQTQGPRIFTFFLYLNDVEEGGETHWPKLGVKVKPRKGWAALWHNVKDDDTSSCDHRLDHEALAVLKGVKYGANLWVHNYDYITAQHWGCTGSFA